MAEQAKTKKTGKFLPLCLTKALQKAIPNIANKRRQAFLSKLCSQHAILQEPEQINLADFLSQYPQAATQLQQKFNVRWVVVQKQWRHNLKVTR